MNRLMIALAGSVLLTGCSTASLSRPGAVSGIDVKGADGTASHTLCVGNEGYYLFNTWPLLAGSMEWHAEKKGIDLIEMAWFRDDVCLQRLSDVFYRYADRENCDAVDVVVHQKTQYPIGIMGIPALFSNIFTTRELYVTGVLKPRGR